MNIAILGLGQIGASIGLALAPHKERITRIGIDRESRVAQQAKKIDAVDKIALQRKTAVQDADLVLLALPSDELQETIAHIAPYLKEGAVVVDTSPAKSAVAGWMKESLPQGRHYVALFPAINPAYLLDPRGGIEAAHADLFKNGIVAVSTPGETSAQALQLATELVRLLEAEVLYTDMLEVDGIMSTVHILPQLIASSLLGMTVGQPGWRDSRKLTGRPYARLVSALHDQDGPGALGASALHNRENITRLLDRLINGLQKLRNDIANQDAKSLEKRLRQAYEGDQSWWQERQVGQWARQELGVQEIPTIGETWRGILLGGLGKKKTRR
ncbi:MAG: prephenate dehydrogenase [Chloroflexota bacterium]